MTTSYRPHRSKKPDRIILFELGIILALLFVNWFMNIEYGNGFVASSDIDEIYEGVFLLPEPQLEREKAERKQEQIIEVKASTSMRLVDDLLKIPPLDPKKALSISNQKIKFVNVPKLRDSVSNPIDEFAQVMPQFPGGHSALTRYVQRNLEVNSNLFDYEFELLIVVRFVVHENGEITDIEVVDANYPGSEIRQRTRILFQKMPPWIPGDNGNGPVKVRAQMPIKVRL